MHFISGLRRCMLQSSTIHQVADKGRPVVKQGYAVFIQRPPGLTVLRTNCRPISYKSTPDPSSRRQYNPEYVIAALIATCSGFLLYNTYADFEAKEKNNYFHRHLIDRNFILTRRNVSEGRWWTGVTYSLMHFNLLHLGLNMVPLWSFGPGILRLIGLPAFGGLWLGSSITAAGATFVGDEWKRAKPNSSEVRDERKFMGASASLLGICTTTAYVFPTTTVALIPIPFPIQIRSAMVGFAAFSVMAYVSDALPFLGHSGHLGGMAFGALYSIVAFRGKAFIPRS